MDLRPRRYRETDFDSVESSEEAARALRDKKCLRDIYTETYRKMMRLKERYLTPEGPMLEIGSGGGFMKDLFPEVITSDVKPLVNVDVVASAERLPFADQSLSAIFATHVIHHIPDVTKFLHEAERTLMPGGGIVCVEPYWSPVARLLYSRFHMEPYDERAPSWKVSGGPLSGSNQAMSYLLLKRDRECFAREFPDLELVYDRPFGFARYIATGGIWLAPMLPDFAFAPLKYLEYALTPLMPLIALHHLFVWRKR